MTLQAFSMPPATPIAMMMTETTIATMIQKPLPTPKIPLLTIMLTPSPRVPVSGAAAPNAAPILSISCPSANSSPLKLILVYLKIQPITTE